MYEPRWSQSSKKMDHTENLVQFFYNDESQFPKSLKTVFVQIWEGSWLRR